MTFVQSLKTKTRRITESSEIAKTFRIATTHLACTYPHALDKLLSHTQESKQAKTEYRILNLNLNSREESF